MVIVRLDDGVDKAVAPGDDVPQEVAVRGEGRVQEFTAVTKFIRGGDAFEENDRGDLALPDAQAGVL